MNEGGAADGGSSPSRGEASEPDRGDTGLLIRPARVADIAAVMRVMEAAFDPIYGEAWNSAQLLTLFALPSAHVAMAIIGDRVCGFYAARMAGPETELLLIAVHPENRQAGIGRFLLEDWQSWAANKGAEDYFLEMRADNKAVGMYKAAGFSECGRRAAYYRGGDGVVRDAITMRKIISGTS
ncbi:MAG TPA: GNAT family N-acetyltransferase [Sphingopyxis sp.]|nr:GNAT family N-acetyltransferase [Sphingopyxis sp.]